MGVFLWGGAVGFSNISLAEHVNISVVICSFRWWRCRIWEVNLFGLNGCWSGPNFVMDYFRWTRENNSAPSWIPVALLSWLFRVQRVDSQNLLELGYPQYVPAHAALCAFHFNTCVHNYSKENFGSHKNIRTFPTRILVLNLLLFYIYPISKDWSPSKKESNCSKPLTQSLSSPFDRRRRGIPKRQTHLVDAECWNLKVIKHWLVYSRCTQKSLPKSVPIPVGHQPTWFHLAREVDRGEEA